MDGLHTEYCAIKVFRVHWPMNESLTLLFPTKKLHAVIQSLTQYLSVSYTERIKHIHRFTTNIEFSNVHVYLTKTVDLHCRNSAACFITVSWARHVAVVACYTIRCGWMDG